MRRMLMSAEPMTDIVEVPAIAVNGVIKAQTPELSKVPENQLREMARIMGGELLFVKMRITYTDLERPFCAGKNCWQLTSTDSAWCDACNDKPHQITKLTSMVRPA